ncbi:MAG: taurine catabolism dioxygenase [Rhodospirillaceae bacterium]|nr:taurine catabolism dioxygenase [Rhodospirillaceae bacterium]HAA93078.1 TauD/TfdA family dioxygenase [Rhodospirillaceae bacterium]
MGLNIAPLSEEIGAEVMGVDLSKPVDDETKAELNEAFAENSVLAIRKQPLSPEQLYDAVCLFGDVFRQHNTRFALPECPLISYLCNQDRHDDGTRYISGSGYHIDHSNDPLPPKATVLLAKQLPDEGGDTQFVNMHRAYEDLPQKTKDRIDGRKAKHVYQSKYSVRKLTGLSEEAKKKAPTFAMHPLVRTHPETGRKSLYINPIRIEEIEGMEEDEMLELLDELLIHATQEKYQYRYKWQPDDMLIWDNRCLMHKANGDYDHDQVRYLYRVMLKGDAPF